jgi:hypothetical protein
VGGQHKQQRADVATRFLQRYEGYTSCLERNVQQAVQPWLCEQPKIFFFEGMMELVERCQKCIIVQGDYVESNMCICSPSAELKLLSRNCLYFLIHLCINVGVKDIDCDDVDWIQLAQ